MLWRSTRQNKDMKMNGGCCFGVARSRGRQRLGRDFMEWRRNSFVNLSWTRDLSGGTGGGVRGICDIQVLPLKSQRLATPADIDTSLPLHKNLSSPENPGWCRQECIPGLWRFLAGITGEGFFFIIYSNVHIVHTHFWYLAMHQGPCRVVFPERKK